MRNGFKRALCILMALTVAFTCLTAVGFSVSAQGSDDYFTYTVNGDEATITGYTRGILGTLEIPGEIDGFRVTAIGDSAFAIRERMKKVVLPQSIERIEHSAFSNCTALEEIVFPENGNISIDRYAFCVCTSLEELYIPSSVKSIGENAFENCRALKKVNYNAACVEGYNVIFEGCNEISQVTLGDAVKDMPRFSETKIKSITLPEGVTEIPYRAFCGCTELEQITVLGEITSSYQADGENGSFYGTPFLENPANRENGVLYLGKAIIDADESVDYGNYTIKEGTVSISEYAFYGCEKLTGITVPESVEEIGSYAFYNTAWNNEANYENGVLYAGDIAVQGLSSWSKIIIKDSVKSIADGAFAYCNMTDLTVPASVKKIGYAVFGDCQNLENVYFEGTADQWCAIDFESAGSCPAAYAENLYFEGQPAVDVTLTQGVESIPAYAFSSELIESISIPSSVKSIGEGAFCRSRKLRSVEIADGVETIGAYAFEHCDSLKEIVLPDSVKEIGGRCFADSAIEKITLSDSLEIIPDRAFMDSTVKEIEWGDNVRKIDERAFLSCYKLEELRFPDSLEEIACNAFDECKSLKTVVFGKSIEYLDDNAFLECENLTNVICEGELEDSGIGVFYGSPFDEQDEMYLGNNLMRAVTQESEYRIREGTKAVSLYSVQSESLRTLYIPASVKYIASGAFSYAYALEKFVVDPNNTEFSSDENGVLYNKDKTKLIYYPKGKTDISFTVPDSVTEISNYAFLYCSVKDVTLGKNTQSIGVAAFSGCGFLRNIFIPASVSLICDGAFNDCYEFNGIYYEGTDEQWANVEIMDDFSNANQPLYDAKLHTQAKSLPETPEAIGFLDNLWISFKNTVTAMIIRILQFFLILPM